MMAAIKVQPNVPAPTMTKSKVVSILRVWGHNAYSSAWLKDNVYTPLQLAVYALHEKQRSIPDEGFGAGAFVSRVLLWGMCIELGVLVN
jgi:hypothetical protein